MYVYACVCVCVRVCVCVYIHTYTYTYITSKQAGLDLGELSVQPHGEEDWCVGLFGLVRQHCDAQGALTPSCRMCSLTIENAFSYYRESVLLL